MQYYTKRQSAFRQMVQIVELLTAGRHSLLDIGCGLGSLLQIAHDHGWHNVGGIEFSHLCASKARQRMRYADIVEGAVEDHVGKFDGVTVASLIDSLRFLQKPGEVLAEVRRALSMNGWVMIREVNAEIHKKVRANEKARSLVRSMESLQEWNPGSLERMLRALGYKNVHSIPSPAFTEIVQGERRHTKSGVLVTTEKLVRRGMYPFARTLHSLTASRIFLRPNFLTFGQK